MASRASSTNLISQNHARIYAMNFTEIIATWLYRFSLTIAIYTVSQSAFLAALAYGLSYLAYIIVTPIGGHFADKLNKRTLITLSYAALALALLATYILYSKAGEALSVMSLLLIVVGVSLIAAASQIFMFSLIPTCFMQQQLPQVYSHLTLIKHTANIIGPILAGLLALSSHLGLILSVSALLFALSACMSWRLCAVPRYHMQHVLPLWPRLRKSARYFNCSTVLKNNALLMCLSNFAVHLLNANLIFLLYIHFELTLLQAGVALGLLEAGFALGALSAPIVKKRLNCMLRLYRSHACISAACLFGLLWFEQQLILFMSVLFIINALYASLNVNYYATRQYDLPPRYIGTLTGIMQSLYYASIPVAACLGGWLVTQYPAYSPLLWLSAMAFICVGYISKPNLNDSV